MRSPTKDEMLFTVGAMAEKPSREFGMETLSASAGVSGFARRQHPNLPIMMCDIYSIDGKPTDAMKVDDALLLTQQAEWLSPCTDSAATLPSIRSQ